MKTPLPSTSTRVPLVRHWLPLLATIALLSLAGHHLWWIGEPFGTSLGDQISAGYVGYSQRAFDAHGLNGLKLQWSLFFHPDQREAHVPYHSHPPLPLVLMRPFWLFLGRNEASLRAFSLVLVGLTIVGMGILWRRTGGSGSLSVPLVLAAVLPATLVTGRIVCPPLFGLPWTLLSFAAYVPSGAGARTHYVRYFVLALVAGLSDWNAFGLVPALWFWIATSGGGRRLREALFVAIPFVLAMFAHGAWCFHVTGGMEGLADLARTIQAALYDPEHRGGAAPDLFGNLIDYSRTLFPVPMLLLALLGILANARGSCVNPRARAGVALFIVAFIPCLVFMTRSLTHEFWLLLGFPAVAWNAAAGATLLLDRLPAKGRGLLRAGVLVGIGILGVVSAHEMHARDASPRYVERSRLIDEAFSERGILIFPDYESGFVPRFYAKTPILSSVSSALVFQSAMQTLSRVDRGSGRLWIAAPNAMLPLLEWALALPRIEGSVKILRFENEEVPVLELDFERSKSFAKPSQGR